MPYLPYKGLIPETNWDYITPSRSVMGNRYVRTTRFPSAYAANYGAVVTKPNKRDLSIASCLNRQAERVGLTGKDWHEDANKWLLDTLLGTVPNKLWFTSLLRQSEDDPSRVAYTERKKDGTYRHVKTTLAKWLGRNCPEMPESKRKQVHENYVLFVHPTPDGLGIHFTDDADEMEQVYDYSSVGSCMGRAADHFESPFHPVRIYAAGDLELAYHVDENGEIDGRGLCRKDTKHYVRWYGQGEPAMAKLGYTQDRKCLKGARVALTYGEDDADGRIVAPYIDGAYEWVSVDEDDTARIGRRGQFGRETYYCQTATSDQHGYSCPDGQDYGYALDDDDDFVTDIDGDRIPRNEAVFIYDDWYHMESGYVRYSGYHGEWYLVDDLTWCEDINDYVENDHAIAVYGMTRRGLSEVMVSDDCDITQVEGLDYPIWDRDLNEAIDRGYVVEVNGDYYDHDSDEIVETEDAGWARKSDCFRHDGDWYTSDSLVNDDSWTVRDGELTRDDGVSLDTLIVSHVDRLIAEADEANWSIAFAHDGSAKTYYEHLTVRSRKLRAFLMHLIDGDASALLNEMRTILSYRAQYGSKAIAVWNAQSDATYRRAA